MHVVGPILGLLWGFGVYHGFLNQWVNLSELKLIMLNLGFKQMLHSESLGWVRVERF